MIPASDSESIPFSSSFASASIASSLFEMLLKNEDNKSSSIKLASSLTLYPYSYFGSEKLSILALAYSSCASDGSWNDTLSDFCISNGISFNFSPDDFFASFDNLYSII